MKDAYRRRRKAELELTKSLPGIDSSLNVTPTHEERLVNTSGTIESVAIQGNDFIVTSNNDWALAMYSLEEWNPDEVSDMGTISVITDVSEDKAECDTRRPVWRKIAASDGFNQVIFIAKDIIASIEGNGCVSTWCALSGVCLDKLTSRHVEFKWAGCKFTETEFVAGSQEGHLCFYTHKNGTELRESKRIWKAHQKEIHAISVYGNKVCSASRDGTVRIWDGGESDKKRLAILYHNHEVYNIAASELYLMSCSGRRGPFGEREIRIFNNGDEYALVKILLARGTNMPRFLTNNVILYWLFNVDSQRDFLVFLELESECVIAQVKVGCRYLLDYGFLGDGRLVTVGTTGFRGVISTLPENLRSLVCGDVEKSSDVKKRRMCTIM